MNVTNRDNRNPNSIMQAVLLSFIALSLVVLTILNRPQQTSSEPTLIYPGWGPAELDPSYDDTKIYLPSVAVFNTISNQLMGTANYEWPMRASRISNAVWVTDNDSHTIKKLDGTTLAVLQTVQTVPPCPNEAIDMFWLDWPETSLYISSGLFYKFSATSGQHLATSSEGIYRPNFLPDFQRFYALNGYRKDPNSALDPVTISNDFRGLEYLFRGGSALTQYNSSMMTKSVPETYFGQDNAAYGGLSDDYSTTVSPDGNRVYAIDDSGEFMPRGDGFDHPDNYKYCGITCMAAATGEILWTLNKDDGFEGLNGNADFNLSGSLLVAVGGRGTGQAHFIKTATKEFVTLNVGCEDDSDVAICTPKHTVYFSLPSQNALLEYPIPNGY